MNMNVTIKKVKQLIAEGVLFAPMDGNHGEKHPKTSDYVESGIPFILVPDLVDGTVDIENCNYISKEQAKTLRKGFSKTGDVLFTHKATIGKVALVDTKEYEYIILTPQVTYYRIKDSNVLNNEYLYYYFQSHSFQETFRLYSSSGGTRDYLGIVAQQRLPIIYPDLNTQKNIVTILSAYDKLIRNNNKRIKLLEQMAENLYKEWFVRFRFPGHENAEFENGIPKGWEIKRLNTIADIVMGQSPESSLYNMEKQGLPFHQGVGSYGEYYLKDEVYSTGGNKIANPNSIIFSVRAPVGRINITLNTIILGRGVASINSKTDNNGFLYWLLKFKFHQEDLIGNGSIFSSVTKKELDNQKFIIPPKDIIQRFDDFAKMIEKNMRVLYLNNENLIKQRNLLLPRLMSGKLEV